MEMEFRTATIDDLDALVALYGAATQDMLRQGIDQWDEYYPDREILTEDVESGDMTLGLLDGEPACAWVVNREYEPEYVSGAWEHTGGDFCVLHRLCVNPELQGRGLARQAMARMEKNAREQGFDSVRLDVFSQNLHAQRLYERLGYKRTGEVRFRKGIFYLMEKGLEE
ncbi:MAG: GNAT family N-acetyltransferase [Eubacteriales bacterium]|nr:GNAT family N-acetyltransferase [Eubacteriales bacterium]